MNPNKAYIEKRLKLGLPQDVPIGELVRALERAKAKEITRIVGTRDYAPVEVAFR